MVLNKDGKINNQQTISFVELADSVTLLFEVLVFKLLITSKKLQLMTYVSPSQQQSLAEVKISPALFHIIFNISSIGHDTEQNSK